MILRELLGEIDSEKIAYELADDFLADEIVKSRINRTHLAHKFKSAITEMQNLPLGESDDSEIAVLKIVDYDSEAESEIFEVLLKKPSGGERYGIEMMSWRELIDLKIADLSLAKYDNSDIAKVILHAMTFFGISEKSRAENLNEEVGIIKKCIEDGVGEGAESFDELIKSFGFGLCKETEAEKELRSKRMLNAVLANNKIYIEFGFMPVPTK